MISSGLLTSCRSWAGKGIGFHAKACSAETAVTNGQDISSSASQRGRVLIAVNVYGHRVEEMKKLGAPLTGLGLNPSLPGTAHCLATHVPHPNAARLYIDFVLSEDGQKLVNGLYKVPIRTESLVTQGL